MNRINSAIPFLGLVLFIVACASATMPEPTMAPSLPPSPTPATQAPLGQQLFASKGCTACHGQNAEGTDVAPALVGHAFEQFERQVRAPSGVMPAFPKDILSDEELNEIISFIDGLGGEPNQASTSATTTYDDLMGDMPGPGRMGHHDTMHSAPHGSHP